MDVHDPEFRINFYCCISLAFTFQLTKEEWELMLSQIVMAYPSKRPKTALPWAFTEQGLAMLSGVLNSD